MKCINCWNDLREFGIVPLTGEACGLSYRLLCDVTERGKRLLEKAMGVDEIKLADNWNNDDKSPHVGSIMLPNSVIPFIGIFALLERGCREVWIDKQDSLFGIEATDSDEAVESFKKYHEGLLRRYSFEGTAGDRNQHVMSGRVR